MEHPSVPQLLLFQCVLISVTGAVQYHLNISDVTSTGFHVRWFHDVGGEGNESSSAESGFSLLIEEEGGERRNFFEQKGETEYVFTDLTQDTTYEVSLVQSSSGHSLISNVQNATTLCGVPSSPVLSSKNLSSRSSRSANLSVQIPPRQEWNCNNITVYLESKTEGQWKQVMTLDPSEADFEVNNLIPCSQYEFRVNLTNYHKSVSSNIVRFQSQAEKLPAVQDLSITAPEKEKLVVTWSPPPVTNNNTCPVKKYKVRYWQVSYKACYSHEEPPFTHSKILRGTKVIIANLRNYSEYTVAVSPMVHTIAPSVVRSHIDGTNTTISGSTQPNYPAEAPGNVLLSGVTESSLTFDWKVPNDCTKHNGAIIGFHYKLSNKDGNDVENGTTDKTRMTFRGLTSNTTYKFTVSASTSVGPGPYSKPLAEVTRYRSPTCPGNSPIRIGGIIGNKNAGLDRQLGSRKVVFMVPRLENPLRKRRWVLKIDFGRSQSCGAGSSTNRCQYDPPNTCPADEGPTDSLQCDPACPRFSNITSPVYRIDENRDRSSLLLTWRDWDMKKDEGIGPVTGYLLRYGEVGTPPEEVQKGLTLHHQFTNLVDNTDYFFEITVLKSTPFTYYGLCEESYLIKHRL